MPTSVRLDAATELALARLARRRKASKSAVLREAVAALAREAGDESSPGSAFERAEDLIGCARGGAPDLSTRTGSGFQRLLHARRSR